MINNELNLKGSVHRSAAATVAFILAMLLAGVPALHAQSADTGIDEELYSQLDESERERMARNARYDIRNLRQMDDFVVDRSEAFLRVPDADLAGSFTVASEAPTVHFRILPHISPEYFSEEAYQAGWANWAKVTRSEDNRFYFAASDHLGRGAQINLYEYRPDDHELERVLDVSELLGWSKEMYTDGKIHGKVGIMPDGTLWAATHRGPEPTDEWWESGYRGSWLLSYNIHSGEAKNWGVHMVGNELPVHTLDPDRGIFMATGGLTASILSWDVNEERVRFAGYPPNGWVWFPRAIFLDPDTGYFWGMDSSERPFRFLSFNPELNRFARHEVELPANPVTGEQGILRGITERKAMDGWYYGSTRSGALFRFLPDWENGPQVETVGVTWDEGRDVVQLALCPAGRYIYYQPRGEHAPLVQYDVQTGEKKALAFLQEHYLERYGYWISSEVFGMEISDDGSFLVIVENGTFEGRGVGFGHPGLSIVEIPASERPLD